MRFAPLKKSHNPGAIQEQELNIGNDIGVVHENSFVLFRATNEHEPKVALVNFH
jgi:hypothetical protein